jgi:hypothetical protein
VYVGLSGLMAANLTQAFWLWYRSRTVLSGLPFKTESAELQVPTEA